MHNQTLVTWQTLGSWMAKRSLKTPDKTALIVAGDERVTYRELADRVDGIATVLWHRGIRKGDSVAYLGENSQDFVAALFACAQLGAVFVPVNTRLAPPEILHVLSDAQARAVIHDPEFTDRLTPLASAVGIEHIIQTGETGADASPGLAALARSAPASSFEAEVTLDDPAAIIYTSGTTGRAKGAILTHQNLTWVALNTIVDYDIVSSDVALMISPLFHVAALGMGALPTILKGGTIVLEKSFDPGRALALIERHGVTMLSGVPTTYQLLADHPDWASTDLSTLQKLTCGGSAVPTRILNAFEQRGLSFSQGYGMTETSPGATALSPEMTRAKQGSVGLPHFFNDVRIADEHGAIVPTGAIGEI
ncbi:MAG: AMP-binding protein, partial [Microbacteriaceae bacterium]